MKFGAFLFFGGTNKAALEEPLFRKQPPGQKEWLLPDFSQIPEILPPKRVSLKKF
jgi:hypothetical protein